MKILLLAAGSDIHSVRWANKLEELGNEVHLCYVSNHLPAIDKINENVKLHKLTFPSPAGYYLNMIQLKIIIYKIKPDVLNAHYASGYGTLARLVKAPPYLLSVYGSDVYDFPYKKKLNMKIIRKNLSAPNAIASTSFAMAKQTNTLIEKPNNDIYITPFGVDVEKFSRKAHVNSNENIVVIGSIKKLSAKYGIKYGILSINYLVKEILTLKNENYTIKYHIYGEGEDREELEALVKNLELTHIIEFKGKIPNQEVPKALNDFDIFLGTSVLDSESFGVAIVEAMACEVPVIVTNVDGFREVVDDGESGIVVNKKDYEAMALEIYKLIVSPEKRKTLGELQRKKVENNYNWDNNAKYMESIYKKLIDIGNTKKGD